MIPSNRTSSGEIDAQRTHPQNEMLKGTLVMMILRTLIGGDTHGQTMAKERGAQ